MRWPPHVALLLDAMSAASAYSTYRKLRSAYAGAAYRVRRADGAQQDIGFAGDFVDIAALNTFCAGTVGGRVTWYDQSGNGRDIISAVPSLPTLRTAAGPVLSSGGIPCASYDGADDSDARTDSGGLSGTTAFTMAHCSETATATFATAVAVGVDAVGPPSNLQIARNPGVNTSQFNYGGGTQQFTTIAGGDRRAHNYVIVQKPAGGTIASSTWEQNGVACPVRSVASGTIVVNLGTAGFRIGAALAPTFNMIAMKCSCAMQFGSLLTGADLAALRTELLQHAPVSAPTPFAALVAACGADLKHFWQPNVGEVILSGSDVATLFDAVGGAILTTNTGNPVWQATGGPGGQACVNLSTTSTLMVADGISFAAGNRIGMYVVGQNLGTVADRILVAARATDGTGGSARLIIGQSSTGKYRNFCAFTGGSQDVFSTVAADANWHLFATRPLSAGASIRRDGVESSPTFTGTDTVGALESLHFGQGFGSAAGKIAMALLVDLSTNAVALDAAIRAYVSATFGLAV